MMKKQDTKLALSVLATLATGIALIYTFIMYRSMIYAIAGVSALFLLSVYVLTKNLIVFFTTNNKSVNALIKSGIDDISSQLEIMGGAQAQLGKATYIYTKQTANVLTRLEDNYAESQLALYKNLASLSSLQNKATGLIIKYNQNNTTKLVSSIKDMHSQLNETMTHGFDQIQPTDSSDVIAILQDITTYLKSQPEGMDQELSQQLNLIAQELQHISSDIQQIEIPAPTVIQSAPANPVPEEYDTTLPENNETIAEPPASIEDIEEPVMNNVEETLQEEILTPSSTVVEESAQEEPAENVAEPAQEESPENVAEPTADIDIGNVVSDENKQLSADEIAALFSSAEPAPKKTEKPADDKKIAEPVNAAPSANNSDKLSADEIAALFAAAEPAPKKEKVPDDPNRQLSAEEIAALVSSMG